MCGYLDLRARARARARLFVHHSFKDSPGRVTTRSRGEEERLYRSFGRCVRVDAMTRMLCLLRVVNLIISEW